MTPQSVLGNTSRPPPEKWLPKLGVALLAAGRLNFPARQTGFIF